MKKAIITGGAGFIGSNLVDLLVEKGIEVTVIDNFATGKRENITHPEIKVIEADICNREAMLSLIKDADVVFHMAVANVRQSIENPRLVHLVNAEGTLNVLEAARAAKIPKFVYVSSSEVYGTAETAPMKEAHPLKPITVYGASKLAGEVYALAYYRTYGLPVVVVRPFNTYGYREHFEGSAGEVIPRFTVRALNNLPVHVFGAGSQTRDFTFVTDTAEGLYKAAMVGGLGEVYNIAVGREVSVMDLVKLIGEGLNQAIQTESLPDRPGDVMRHFADISKAREQLQFDPKIDIKSGLDKYLGWFKKTFPDPKVTLEFYQAKNW